MSTTSKPNNHNLLFSPISEKKVALRKIAITTFAGLFSLHVCAQSTQEKRENYLREALEINIAKDHRHAISRRVTLQDSTWLDWQKRTGELPPDFEQMTSAPFLPEPLELIKNGQPIPIRTIQQWKERREEIKIQFQHWVSGTIPPAPRGLLFHYFVMERQLNPCATEQCYQSVKKVYDFLGAGDQIGLFPRMGEHAVAARDVERCIDFLDIRFKRNSFK